MNAKRFPAIVQRPAVRLIAAQVFLLSSLSVILQNPWIALILAVDFALRSLVQPRLSPLAFISRSLVVSLLHVKGQSIYNTRRREAEIVANVLQQQTNRHRGGVAIGELLPAVLARLGINTRRETKNENRDRP